MSESLIAHFETKRNLAHKRLEDAVICARKCLKDSIVLPRFETWCSRLDIIIEAFNEGHTNLISELKKSKATEETINNESSYQEQADDMYFEVLEAKRKLLPEEKSLPKLTSSHSETKSNSKLPAIKLPSFSGNLKDFPGYLDLFNTLVHNRTDLSNVEKFQYLQSSLSGEPVNIIRAYPISEANYLSAYSALVNRYDNKRYLAFMCWEQINNLKPMNSGSVTQMRNLLDTFKENLAMLNGLGLPTSNWDFVLFHSLLTKIDKSSREAFELSCKGDVFPRYEQLKSFVEDRCSALERSNLSNNSTLNISNLNKNQVHSQPKSYQPKPPTMLLAQSAGSSCVLCKSNHALYACPNFISKSPQDRIKVVKQNKLCFNCLRSNHTYEKCVSTHTCKICNMRHNSLLHISSNKQNNNSFLRSPLGSGSSFVMLATAEVEVKDCRGSYQRVRVLLDPGSQSQIITNSCVKRLGLSQYKSNIPMSGIGEIPTQSNSKVFLEIRPIGKSEPTFTTEALTLNKICGNMPSHHVNQHQFQHVVNLKLADEQYHHSRPVDLLIGGEIFPHILLPGKIDGGNNAPTAINTVFGFVLMGKTSSSSSCDSSPVPLSINHMSLDANLDIAVQKFWEIDNIESSSKSNLSEEDVRCEEIYQSTHKRDADGRYTVQLPFRDQEPRFKGSYHVALRRFNQLEKRLLQNPTFHQEYAAHIMEYLSTGQMEEVPQAECQSPSAYYIPHHAVVKLDRKLRVVYDASAKDQNGVSLNDNLLTGCKLQADISIIILRFRLHAIVFTADVRQMYRQIIITKNHQDYQRILFRSSPEQPIQEYRLQRVTFGVSSAPFLAIRTMQQLADDEDTSYPLAAEVLRHDLYVDDVVTGAHNITQAVEIKQQLVDIMASAGFELRKWSSNHAAVLQDIPDHHKAVPDVTFDSDSNFVKVLGLAWNSQEDIFNYQVNQTSRDCTKRSMLSELARIYDPIGLLTPLTFLAKHLIQRLWLLGTSWDEPVPDDINHIWTKYTQQLAHLSQLQIPRRITRDNAVSYQLHGFCDASEAGYAAVVYLRSSDSQGHHHVAIMIAKSRVAPTKRRTLPRLELCGASLLADLMKFVVDQISNIINIDSIHAWSDSMIVLAWIKSKSSCYKAFVGNRISNIQRKLPNATWKHVPGKQNPADSASRGLSPDELINNHLWWTGPQWLAQDQHQWPDEPVTASTTTLESDEQISCEKRSNVLTVTTTGDSSCDNIFDQLINKFSSLRKIQRILAYCYRAQSQLSNIMKEACETERIAFVFNPAGAPHQGGLWEAGVKAVKTHLFRVIGNQTLTYEELNTLLAQVESILNSRPLCPLSSDPNDLSVLTPGHFLTLAPLTTVPTPDYTNVKINRLTRWQLLQRMHQDFWNRWHTEYLTTLSQRLKWTKPTREVKIGQMVIIKDESTHPLKWRFGRIANLFYGRDGIPRSASIQTVQGVLSRPLVKLCPIPEGWE
ncbi:hypothetical protein ABMA27_002135 [Loxostege sticticalis]|uniref:DUF5641 domain-containing protein n=1 Tax=Loxostege sticticalis TaxID=481309 RepID=A0ABR3HWN8_LOXSC